MIIPLGSLQAHGRSSAFNFIMICVIASMLAGCGMDDEQSEASKWEAKLEQPHSQTATLDWTSSYVRFRDHPDDATAADSLRAASHENPDDTNLMMALAIAERDSGHLEASQKAFEHVIEKNPNRAGALWNLGRFAQANGNLELAEKYFERAGKSEPQAWQPIYAMSHLKRMQGQVEQANALWKEAKRKGAGKTSTRGGMDGHKTDVGIVLLNMDWD